VIAYLLVEQVERLLPISFAFAAGAMLALVAWELAPSAVSSGRVHSAVAGGAVGAAVMLALSVLLGV
jgi:ZIP family zinc transporter